MSSYNVEPCNFKYRVSALEKVVDGDTIDVAIDLGFDVCTKQRSDSWVSTPRSLVPPIRKRRSLVFFPRRS